MPARSWSRATLDTLATLSLIAASSAIVWNVFVRTPASVRQPPPAVSDVDLVLHATDITNVTGTGSVALVEFSDFQCPFCKRFATETLPEIRRTFIDGGRVRYVTMQFPLERIHPLAMDAGKAAECARRDGHYWDMHERLFSSRLPSRDTLFQYARELSLDEVRFRTCLEGVETEATVRADQARGARLGVNATPAFFVGLMQQDGSVKLSRRINGAVAFDVFAKELENAAPKEAALRPSDLP